MSKPAVEAPVTTAPEQSLEERPCPVCHAPAGCMVRIDGVYCDQCGAADAEYGDGVQPAEGYAALQAALQALEADHREALANLTAVQARCTELKLELRAYRASGICLPGWHCCHCGGFNGSAKEVLAHCRGCGEAKPA